MKPYNSNPEWVQLKAAVKAAYDEMLDFQDRLKKFEDDPANNVFESIQDAGVYLEEKFVERAREACEGAHNFGEDRYEQEFTCNGKRFLFEMDVEYNRHDKTYYFLEGWDTNIISLDEVTREDLFEIRNNWPSEPTEKVIKILDEYKELRGW